MAVITISRQSGSEGNTIAQILCQRLGYGYFDKNMMLEMAKELGWDPEQVADISADGHTVKSKMEKILRNFDLPYGVASSGPLRTYLTYDEALSAAMVQFLVLSAYDHGNVVIIGRGSQIILGNKPDVLHVRVVAPLEKRIANWQAREKLTYEEAQQKIAERDAAHIDFVETYFDMDLIEPLLYDLVINTGKFSPEEAAEVILEALKKL